MSQSPKPEHVWYYRNPASLNLFQAGPFNEKQFGKLITDGTVRHFTKIRSPTRTNDQWLPAQEVAPIAKLINAAVEAIAKNKLASLKEQAASDEYERQATQNAIAESERAKQARLDSHPLVRPLDGHFHRLSEQLGELQRELKVQGASLASIKGNVGCLLAITFIGIIVSIIAAFVVPNAIYELRR